MSYSEAKDDSKLALNSRKVSSTTVRGQKVDWYLRTDFSFCKTARNVEKGNVSDSLFSGVRQVYVAHADAISAVEVAVQRQIKKGKLSNVGTYASVVGGMSGLNVLSQLSSSPKKIIFYDVNPWALSYAQMFILLISCSTTRHEFVSNFFSRKLICTSCTNVDEASFLQSPHEASIQNAAKDCLASHKDSLCAYAWLQEKFMRNHLAKVGHDFGPRYKCERVVLLHSPLKFPMLDADPLRTRPALNNCTLYYGHGWLSSAATYMRVRDRLMQASVHFVGPIDITVGKFFPQEMLSKHTAVYVSNIAKFEPSKWRNMKHNLQTGNLPSQVDRISFVHSSKYGSGSTGLVEDVVQAEFRPCIKNFPAHFTAHQNAWRSVKSWIPRDTSRVIEVTSRVPWGFHKQLWDCRQHCSNNVHITEVLNGSLTERLKAADGFPHKFVTILHILVGERALDRGNFIDAIRLVSGFSSRIVILQHNGSSKDWRGENNGFHISHRLLANEIAAKVPKSTVVQRCDVAGQSDFRRNMLVVVDVH